MPTANSERILARLGVMRTARLLQRLEALETLVRAIGPEKPKKPKQEAENTYNLPQGRPLRRLLIQAFRAQRKETLAKVPKSGTELPVHIADLSSHDGPMAEAMTPILRTFWQDAGKKVVSRVGLVPGEEEWRVVNPLTAAKIKAQAMAFCQRTNATTTKQLNAALAALRQELAEGVVKEGESLGQLTKRVQKVFDTAETSRARRIAATETSRAVHAAQEDAAIASGVVAGFEWLISGDACPLCKQVAAEAKYVKAGQPFAIVGHNPAYSTIRHPPLHPSCQCALVEVLKPEYGGPEEVPWADTLVQPRAGQDYAPPDGQAVPEPEPEKHANPPVAQPPPAPPPTLADQHVGPRPEEVPVIPADPIGRAVALARLRGVEADPDGGPAIARVLGASRARAVPAAYRATDRRILINRGQEHWADPAADMAQAAAVGWFSSAHPDHIITHEIGHAMHHRAVGDAEYERLRDARFTRAQLAKIGDHVSRYGRTRPVEFVAETFAGLAAGKVYNAEVMGLYRQLGGPTP